MYDEDNKNANLIDVLPPRGTAFVDTHDVDEEKIGQSITHGIENEEHL